MAQKIIIRDGFIKGDLEMRKLRLLNSGYTVGIVTTSNRRKQMTDIYLPKVVS